MKGNKKIIKFKSIFFMLIAFMAFFSIKNIQTVEGRCWLGSITVTANVSDANGGTVAVPSETCKYGNITLTATEKTGYTFFGWLDSDNLLVSDSSSYSFTGTGNVTLTAVFAKNDAVVVGTKGNYTSLKEALNSGDPSLYLVKEISISENLTIPSGTKLTLPYAYASMYETTKGTAETAITRVPWSTQENIDRFRYLNVTIASGATLTVNGSLVIAAVQHYPHQANPQGLTSGKYSQITNNGNIIVNGSMKVYGLLNGTGTLTINNAAKLYEPFMLNDFAGGTNTEAFVDEGQMPFKQFAMINIQCHQYINYGAIVYGVSSIYARILINSEITIQEVPIIGTDPSNAIFALDDSNASVEITYKAQTINQTLGNIFVGDCGVSTIKTHGNVTFGQFKLEQYHISSSSLGFFGLPYTFNIIIGSDSSASILSGYSYKLLPGSLLKVEEGGIFNIDAGGNLLIYDGLIQADKSGKQYPDATILSTYGFDKSAMFILDGTLNINGMFAGIIQTNGTGVVNVSSTATLSAEVVDGSETGHEDSVDNQTVFDMSARVYGLTGYINLETGKIYKGFSNDDFILETFTVTDAGEYTGDLSITMNQSMTGRILEWNGSEYVATVDYYIGEKIEGIEISIDGTNQKTNSNGMITISHTFTKNEIFNYYTVDKEDANTLHSIILTGINQPYFTLNGVIKSITLNGGLSDGSYRKYEDEIYDITATVTYYGNTTSIINITEPVLNDAYIVNKDVELTSGTYKIENNKRTLINIPRAFEVYNNNVSNLKTSTNLVDDASTLWNEYLSYLNGRNTDDTNFITGELIHDFGSLIVTGISVGQVTYGDNETTAIATTINGSTISVSAYSSGYTISPLSTEFTYSSNYLGNSYSYTVNPTRINSKALKITVKDITVTYGDSAELTIEFLDESSYLVNNDSLDKVFLLTREEGNNVGTYDIYASLIHPGYTVESINDATYTINKRDITITVNKHKNIMLTKAPTTVDFDVIIDGKGTTNPEIILTISKYSQSIASISNNKVTVEAGKTYGVGSYDITADVATGKDNYNITTVGSTFNVVEDIEYYTVEFIYFNDDNYIYDGSETIVKINATYSENGDPVVSYKTTITGPSSEKIVKAGTYTIDVDIEHLTYSSTFTIAKRVVTLNIDKNEFYYNANVQQPTFYLTNIVDGDDVNVGTETKDTVNAGTYTVSATTLSGYDSANYELPEVKTMAYEIKKLDITVTTSRHSNIMLSKVKNDIAFDTSITGDNGLIDNLVYEVRDGDELIAIITNGKVTVQEGKTYDTGTYEIFAVIDLANYNVTSRTSGSITVVEDIEYYTVEFIYSNDDNYTYDGSETIVTINAIYSENGDPVVSYKTTITGPSSEKIVKAGTYTIDVDIEHLTYSSTFTIAKRVVTLNIDKNEFYYNANVQQPTFYLTNIVDGDDVNVGTETKDTVNAGTYTVSATTLSGDDSANYELPEVKTMAYEIKVFEATLSLANHNDIMLNNKDTIVDFALTTNIPDYFEPNIIYEIRQGSDVIAKVKDGIVIECEGKVYGVGTYQVYPVITNNIDNYSVTVSSGSLRIVENNEYYEVIVEFYQGTTPVKEYIYDKNYINVLVKVFIDDIDKEVTNFTYNVNGYDMSSFNNAGTYTVNVNVDDIDYSNAGSIVIAKKTVTLNIDKNEFYYNANVQQPTFYLTNIVDGDDVNVGTETKDTVNAGTYTVSATTLSGDDSANYELPEVKTMAYEIKKLDITVTTSRHSNIMLSKVKNDIAFDTSITGDNGLIDNLVYEVRDGDELIAIITNGKVTVQEGKTYDTGTYEIFAVIDLVNYNVTSRTSGSITVVEDKAYYDVEILFLKDGISIESAVYDGKQIEVEVNVYIAETGESIEDFTYQIIKPTMFSLRGNIGEVVIKNASYYSVVVTVEDVIYDDVAAIVVEPKQLTLGVDATEFTYNGENQQSKFFITGFVEGDNVDVKTSTNDSINVGNDYEVYASLVGEDMANYVLPENTTQTYTIKPLDIQLDVARHNDIMLSTTNNEINFDLTITGNNGLTPEVIYEIKKNNELIATVVNGVVTVEEGKTYGVGTYEVYARVDSTNYNVSEYSLGSITIVEDKDYYDVNVSFVKNEEVIESAIYDGTNINTIVNVKVKETGEVIENYSFTVNGNSNSSFIDANTYNVNVIVGTVEYNNYASITIAKRELNLDVDMIDFTYNGLSQYPTFELINVIDGDDVSVTARKNTINAGNYTITASLSGNDLDNYEFIGDLTRDYIINPLKISVTIQSVNSVYGNAIILPSFTCNDSIMGADNIYNFITLTKEEGLDVGTYDIIGTNSNNNYDVTFYNEKDSYTITPRSITVAIDNVEVLYGEDEVELSANVSLGELSYQDTLSELITLSREEGNDAGSYKISATNKSDNYSITFTAATYIIKPRDITLKINNASNVYGDNFSDLTLDIVSGSMAKNENEYDLVSIVSNYQKEVGVYDIRATKIDNINYNVTITYTGAGKSLYEVRKRPITILGKDIEVDNDATYNEILSLLDYEISEGNIINGDDLDIDLSIKLQSGVTLTRENFASNFSGGVHTINITASNSNYDITIINGTLTVTKCVVSIKDLVTNYTYNDGLSINPFTWEDNISGYDKSATANSFGYKLSKKDIAGNYVEVDALTDAGEYRITINIIHTHAYEFSANTNTTYDIIVDKKDISDEIELYNIPTNNVSEYQSLGFVPGVELPSKYTYVNYTETLVYNNEEVYQAQNVGKYVYTVTIDNANYKGSKSVEFEIVKKDISSNIVANIHNNDIIALDKVSDININLDKYDVKLIVSYEKLNSTIIANEIGDIGLYNIHVTIDDDCYMGEMLVQVKIVPSVATKIENLEDLSTQFNIATSSEDKKEIMDQVGLILSGLTDDDKILIDANNEYQEIVKNTKEKYDNYILQNKNTGNNIINDNNKGIPAMAFVWIGIAIIIMIIVISIYVYKVSKRRKMKTL